MKENRKKILVTGSAGFIGYHLTKKLLDRAFEVVGLDSINDYYDVKLKYDRLADCGISREEAEQWHKPVQSSSHDGYRFIRMNLEDREEILSLFEKEKFDKVVNLAAQAGVRYSLENPYSYVDSNVVGFINILEGCRHNDVKHLVYASSSSVYGNNTKMPLSTSDSVDHPISLYAATKKANELMAHTYSHLYGIPTTGLRFFTVYGPWGRPDMALFLFTDAIINDQPIKVFNHGNMVRDFTYVDDITEGVFKVMEDIPKPVKQAEGEQDVSYSNTAPYKVYNIGNSSPVKLMDFITAIEKSLGKEAQKNFMDIQPGDVPRTEADVTDLEKNLGYKPDTKVQDGIDAFIKWYRVYYSV
jgi:UDP-glucuronate 4-epimerase